MAPRDPDVPWSLVGRNGRHFPVPGDKHWQCRQCTDELRNGKPPWYNPPHLENCNKCNQSKHPKAMLYCHTKMFKKTKAAAAAVSPPKAGAGGVAADTDATRKLQRQLAASQKELADFKKAQAAEQKEAVRQSS